MAADLAQPSIRLLAVFCEGRDGDPGYDPPGGSSIDALAGRPGLQVEVLRAPTRDELVSRVEALKPTIAYLRGPYCGQVDRIRGALAPLELSGQELNAGELVSAFEGIQLDTVYLDAAAAERAADLFRARGVPHVLFWSEDPVAVVAAQFASTFFTALATLGVTAIEAYTLSLYSTQAHCGAKLEHKLVVPGMPDLLAGPIGEPEGPELQLPDNTSVPPLQLPGLDLSKGIAAAVPAWSELRLLAPRAEVRLLLAGGSAMVDATRLSYLGEALRAALVLQARSATLLSSTPCAHTPSHLPASCSALLCRLETAGGAQVQVVIGVPPAVASSPQLLEHALRQTLVADSLSLQFRLPPAGLPSPVARTSSSMLGGTPTVECLAMTSVWAVHVMRLLAQKQDSRALISLGVVGVGSSICSTISPADTLRLHVVVTGTRPSATAAPSTSDQDHSRGDEEDDDTHRHRHRGGGGSAEEEGASGAVAAGRPFWAVASRAEPSINPMAVPADPPIPPHGCSRRAFADCSEQEFLRDVLQFLQQRRGRSFDASRFPDAVLNGTPLDLYGLYREVTSRGGFRAGNGINWKGKVFSNMKNWTPQNRQTGVGNSLKRHYANYLWEYEQAHPQDVATDRCTICGEGEESGATDWIACDSCNCWVHFSCDKRPGLDTFASYTEGVGRSYLCPSCAAVAAAAAAAAAEAAPDAAAAGGEAAANAHHQDDAVDMAE